MTLRNAFECLATEQTLANVQIITSNISNTANASNTVLSTISSISDNTRIYIVTYQKELLQDILKQMKIMNIHLSYISGLELEGEEEV